MIFAKAVTPYWLFEDLKKEGRAYQTYPIEIEKYTKDDPKKLVSEFLPKKI